MRIISGSLKGRSISVPKNFKGRPTTDFAREGLFNVLANLTDIQDATVLDLFAGTGAFSLECISRGAASATCVDIQPLHVKFINDNFRQFGIDHGDAIKQDVFRFAEKCDMAFDIVFADPPYDLKQLESLPNVIVANQLVKPGGWFVIEHGKQTDFSGEKFLHDVRQYSNVSFSFFHVDA